MLQTNDKKQFENKCDEHLFTGHELKETILSGMVFHSALIMSVAISFTNGAPSSNFQRGLANYSYYKKRNICSKDLNPKNGCSL